MKKMIGTTVLLLALLAAVPAHAITQKECFDNLGGDYYISFKLTSFSGKVIEDGYLVTSNYSNPGWTFDLCGYIDNATKSTDSFDGEVYDTADHLAFLKGSGTIIWDAARANAYVQGGFDNAVTSSYIDGTIKCSRGKCSLTAKGGINDYSSFIVSYTSIKGSGIPAVRK